MAVIVFPEQKEVVRCIYCQYPNQRPRAIGETLDKLKKANRLLKQCQFDDAEECYIRVLEEYPDEHEALWGRLMCKYGVEVAKEEKYGTVHRYLLCHRARRSSIRNEGDFLDACKYADPIVREQYEKDAAYIDKVQQKIREAAERQEAYDVFICYKETDLETGERTKDSMIAQQLYNRYTRHGYRVFFARETLCDKYGEDYEAAIYQAIATAKVMLVVGLNKEHYQAIWPKSEWMRYLEKMEQGEEGGLIPVYGDMRAEELPDQFQNLHLQGCCITTNLAYIEDIERRLYWIIHNPVSPPPELQVHHEESPLEGEPDAPHNELPKITYPEGEYVGEIVNGKRHGKGVMYYGIGDKLHRVKYDGEWKDDMHHGHGVINYDNGTKYEGEFKKGDFSGYGVHTCPDGSGYNGGWEEGLRHGHGVETWKDGRKYEGDWINDCYNGHGVFTWADGSKYDGEWKGGMRTGKGVYYYANGDRYEGDFLHGEMIGRGTLFKQNGKRIRYQNGKPKKFF